MSIKDVYMYVFQRTQWEIGRLWQTNKLTVAEEHIFTAATQLIMSQLYPYLFGETDFKGKVIAACVGRELHEVGLRMVADFLEMDGWNTIYVGANTPTRTLLETISKEHPDIIALSITIIPHLKNLRDVIKHIRDNRNFNHIKIIVGGYPFIQENRLWKQVNADGSAINAEEAVKLANQFFE